LALPKSPGWYRACFEYLEGGWVRRRGRLSDSLASDAEVVEGVVRCVGRSDARDSERDVGRVALTRLASKTVVDVGGVDSRLAGTIVEDRRRGSQREFVPIEHGLFLWRDEEQKREWTTFFSSSASSIRCSYSVFCTGRLVKVEGWA
jgi:hypothetical protein